MIAENERDALIEYRLKQASETIELAKFGKILRNAYQNRTKGDYDAFITFSPIEVEFMLKEMAEFIEEIKRILDRNQPALKN